MKTADLLTMEQDPGEAHRRAAVEECLDRNKTDTARHVEVGGFLESILLLKYGFNAPAISNKEDINKLTTKEEDSNTVFVKEKSSHSTSSDTIVFARPIGHTFPSTEHTPNGYLITPISNNLATPLEEKAQSWSSSDSSILSSPPERILTPEGWSSLRSSDDDNMIDASSNSGQETPTMARLEGLAAFAEANYSAFNALLDVANVAADELNYSNRDMTLEKVKAGGIFLELDEHNRNPGAKKVQIIEAKMSVTQKGNGQTAAFGAYTSPTKEDLIKRMEDQSRRTG